MEKTFTVNIGGIVFHINEDAYIALNQYLKSLKLHLGQLEERDEIYNDIEQRISEILQGKISETKQVVTLEDVEDVIRIMGQPGQFDGDADGKFSSDDIGDEKRSKRFYRNPDEKIIGGVCSGIAAYFNLDPVLIRILLVISVVFGGFGILLYIILWVVIPEAVTTSDRLRMRGEKINISNIERKIRGEFEGIRGKAGELARDSAAAIKRAGSGSATFFELVGHGLLSVLRFTWKVIIVLTGIVMMVFGIIFLIAFVAFIFGWTAGMTADSDPFIVSFPVIAHLLLGCTLPIVYIQIILLMLFGIPSLMLFYNGSRMVFRFDRIRHLGLTVFNIWIVAVVFLTFFILTTVRNYSSVDEKTMEIAFEKPSADTLFLNLRAEDPGMEYLTFEKYAFFNDNRVVMSDERELLLVPDIRFEETDDTVFSAKQILKARGRTQAEARQNLVNIRYQLTTNQSNLEIGPYARLPKGECWRGQEVGLVLCVPKGKFVKVQKELVEMKHFWLYLDDRDENQLLQMREYGMEKAEIQQDTVLTK